MSDFLEFRIDLQFDGVKRDRKAFHTMMASAIAQILLAFMNLYLFIGGNLYCSIACGMLVMNALWSKMYCIDYFLDYQRSKKDLDSLINMRSNEIVKLQKNIEATKI